MASPKRFIHLVVDEEGRFEVVLDQWRDLSIHLARLSVALERPVVERRGRPRPKPPRGRVRERAAAYGVDVARLEAGIHRTVEQRLVRLDENLAFGECRSPVALEGASAAMSFQSMLAGLVSAPVSFVVIGGVAGAIHGSERVTNHLDVVCDASDGATLSALAVLLDGWHAYPRGVEKGLPFIMDVRTLRSTPVLTLGTSEGDLDLLDRIDGVGDYRAVLAHSVEVEAFQVSFRVLDLPTLIKAKRATGRPKDREAILELELLRDLTEE